MNRNPPLTRLVFLGITLLVLSAVGCGVGLIGGPGVRGSGVKATEARQVGPFRGIDLRGSLDLNWRQGDKPEVEVIADENLLDLVVTEVRDGTLLVSTRGSWQSRLGISIRVTSPAIEKMSISGSGDARLEGLSGPKLTLLIRGSGDIVAGGEVDRLEIKIQGSGDVQAFGLPARLVSVSIAGSGDAEVDVGEALEASIHGSGDVVYHGEPDRVERQIRGSGDIIHRPHSEPG